MCFGQIHPLFPHLRFLPYTPLFPLNFLLSLFICLTPPIPFSTSSRRCVGGRVSHWSLGHLSEATILKKNDSPCPPAAINCLYRDGWGFSSSAHSRLGQAPPPPYWDSS